MKKLLPLFQQSIKIEPVDLGTYNKKLESGIMIPSGWQCNAKEYGKKFRYMIFDAPGGVGKTFLAVCISLDEIIISKNTRKHIFIAPTIEIGENFCRSQNRQIKIKYKGMVRLWEVPKEHKFNSENPQSIKGLKEFLLADPRKYPYNEKHITGPIATATHRGFVMTWEKLTNYEKKKALRNLTVHVDECHHSKSTPLDSTHLGDFVRDVCTIHEPTCNVNFYTATYHRTDRGEIVPNAYKHHFEKWVIPLNDYLSIIKIKEFNFRFTHYRKDPLTQIIRYMKEHKDQRHIVILPDMGNRFREEGTLKKYLKAIHEIYPASKVLDLVTPETQKKNRELLRRNHKKYWVAVSCRIFYEGYDWPPAAVLHNTSYGKSQVTFSQIMFRIFRCYPKKDKIWLYIYVPPIKKEERNNIRALYSDRLNLFLTSIVMSELCAAIRIPLLPTAPFYRDKKGSTSLSEIMAPDILMEMRQEIIKAYDYNRKQDKPEDIEILLSLIADLYHPYVEDHLSFDNFKDTIKTEFVRIIRLSRNRKIEHITIDFVRKQGFDKIARLENVGSIVFGTKEPLTEKDLYELKDIMEKALLLNMEKDGEILKKAEYQDHVFQEIPVKKPIQSIKDIKGEWITFDIPPKAKVKIDGKLSKYARVIEQDGLDLEIAIYQGDIVIENEKIVLVVFPGLIQKDREEKFIYCNNYWRSDYAPQSLTPSNAEFKIVQKFFLFEGNIFPGRKKAPYKTMKIRYEWIRYIH